MKLLLDECLSEELAKLARERGHREASHVRWIGKAGLDALEEDDDLINRVIEITLEDAGDAEIGITHYELPAE